MATKTQVEKMIQRWEEIKPTAAFKCVDETQAGMGAVLRLLEESGQNVTAGGISEVLEVSTARVAVLLKKMTEKGLIFKERSEEDARVTVVTLTELGKKKTEEMREELYRQVGHMIDMVGEERLTEFITIASEIQKAMLPPRFTI